MSNYHGNVHTRDENNNHSNQFNKTSYVYWSSRTNNSNIYDDGDYDAQYMKRKVMVSANDIFVENEYEFNSEGDSMFVEIPAKSIVYYRNDAIKEIENITYFNINKIITLSIKIVDEDIELVKRIPEAVIKKLIIEKNRYFELNCEMYNIQYSYQMNNEFKIYIPIDEKNYVDRIKDSILK